MITGFHKAKCHCRGHEFIAMEGGFLPNAPVGCPKCGTEIRSGSSSVISRVFEVIFGRGDRHRT